MEKNNLTLNRLPFSGQSMWPFFKEGDELLVSFQKPSPETGDVVIVKDEHLWVSHRIVVANGKTYLKGDFSTQLESINQNQIWGLVCGLERQKKSIIWGSKGHRLKSIVARLSTMGVLTDKSSLTRLKRWSSLTLLLVLSKFCFKF